jgi:hypothetical protein
VFCRRHGFVAQGLKATDEEIYAACERAQACSPADAISVLAPFLLNTLSGYSDDEALLSPFHESVDSRACWCASHNQLRWS